MPKKNKFGHLIALMVKECPICFEVTRICKEICLLSVCLWIHLETEVFIESMYRALARPYAQAIAGNFSFARFGVESGHFRSTAMKIMKSVPICSSVFG